MFRFALRDGEPESPHHLKTDGDMDQRRKATFGAMCVLFLSSAVSAQKVNLPDGKGKAELIHDCTACHNTDLVVRVKKTPEAWKKTVYEMADRGVDASDEELDTIVRYLSTNFGIENSKPTATHVSSPSAAPERAAAPRPAERGVNQVGFDGLHCLLPIDILRRISQL